MRTTRPSTSPQRSPRRTSRGLTLCVATTLGAPMLLGLTASPATAATVPAGAFADAYGLSIDTTVLAGNIPVQVDPIAPSSSSCPPAAMPKTASLLSGGDPAVAEVGLLNTGAATDCAVPKSLASAQVENADALGLAGPIAIHADSITSTASADCAANPTGSTRIVNLTVGGTAVPLPLDQAPNTELLAPIFNPLGIRVILNEQHPAASGRGIVVNGIHIIASDSGALPIGGEVIRGDVVISHAAAGVVCPGGPGSTNGTLPPPDITFDKTAAPSVAEPGDTVTYTAKVTNTSTTPCEVLRFIEHVAPPFELVSTAGPLGTTYDTPAPVRTDGGVDAVLRPTGVVIAAKGSVTQTFAVKVKDGAAPGTYYDSLEIFCGPNGNFVSGPLAPVTIPAEVPVVVPPKAPPVTVVVAPPTLPRTGGAPVLAALAVLLTGAGISLRRLRTA